MTGVTALVHWLNGWGPIKTHSKEQVRTVAVPLTIISTLLVHVASHWNQYFILVASTCEMLWCPHLCLQSSAQAVGSLSPRALSISHLGAEAEGLLRTHKVTQDGTHLEPSTQHITHSTAGWPITLHSRMAHTWSPAHSTSHTAHQDSPSHCT
jgi:hypothetical protein